MLPGRGRPPQPPHAAAVAADCLPRLAPAPAAAGAAAMSPRPTNRKQAAPEPRRFLRGDGGLSTSPPVGRRGDAGRVAGAVRDPRAYGKCSLSPEAGQMTEMLSFLDHLFSHIPPPAFCFKWKTSR